MTTIIQKTYKLYYIKIKLRLLIKRKFFSCNNINNSNPKNVQFSNCICLCYVRGANIETQQKCQNILRPNVHVRLLNARYRSHMRVSHTRNRSSILRVQYYNVVLRYSIYFDQYFMFRFIKNTTNSSDLCLFNISIDQDEKGLILIKN